MESARRALMRLAAATAIVASLGGWARAAETEEAVDIRVENASAKVGESAYVIARIVPRAGFEIAGNYRNRLAQFSANEDSVQFESKAVRGVVQDGALLFKVPVVPKKPGPNAINGVMRFAFVSESDGHRTLDIKTAPLIATVTGSP